ncbi:transporter substrate-binding domain-containing protein [Anderseniella sp. Alg231-50]|uniref:transporter substrate-binding domain-containing protein n=1 Tax=Anderseniella sp. Alg231-50 TaxID=1922226 RepID=UPI000D55C5C8
MKFAYLIEPPFNYEREDGTVTGCDVELARLVFDAIGAGPFEPVEAEFAELLPGVAEGRWRMTTGLFATEERRQLASFSRPVWALPDGLLVTAGNPLALSGYKSVAASGTCRLAVIRDQFQHRSAVEFGVQEDRIMIFETYTEACHAVRDGKADAYASVARAHTGFLEQHAELDLEVVVVPAGEKQPAFGSFAFSSKDDDLRHKVDAMLADYLGSPEHRRMMAGFGFSDAEIDLVANRQPE